MEIEDAVIDDHNGVSLPVSKYFKALVNELHDEPENFHKFILLLQNFKNKSVDHIGFLLKLKELLKHKPNLFNGFKELIKEVNCVEGERTKTELAFLYVCKVKDHFRNDQRFQTFTEISAKFVTKAKTKIEVYQEMQKLFGSHSALFEEFRKFYGATSEAMPPPTEPAGGTPKNQDGSKDRNKEEQECNKSNIGHKKANLVKPRSPSKRKRIQTSDIIMANHLQEVGGFIEPDVRVGYVNSEMDRPDKAKSCRRDREAERDKAPVADDEIVPEVDKAPVADDEIVPEVDKAPVAGDEKVAEVDNVPIAGDEIVPEVANALVADDEIAPEPPVSEGDDSVQNDDSVAAKGSCGQSVRLMNQYDKSLFKLQDDRFEFDMLQNLVASTAMRAEELLKKISNKQVKQVKRSTLCLEDHFTDLSLFFIEEMYGDYGLEVMETLRSDPAKALPVILARLEKKKEDLSICGSHFNKIWRACTASKLQIVT